MKYIKPIASIAGAFLFYYLFFDYNLGINQAIFGLLLLSLSIWITKDIQRSVFLRLNMLALAVLSVSVAWHGESWTRFVHFWLCWLLAGNITIAVLFAPLLAIKHAVFAPLFSFRLFVNDLTQSENGNRKISVFNQISIYSIPLTLVVLFIAFYRNSNPLFDSTVSKVTGFFERFFTNVDFASIITVFMGLVIMNMFLFPAIKQGLADKWSNQWPIFTRNDCKIKNHNMSGLSQVLKYEYKSASFLMLALNGLLFFLNITDLKVVWFGFDWSGQLLKSFVHEGTWYLIFSIIISLGVLLFVFRGNINFYPSGHKLKKLAGIWLLQNAFLALSVGLRNIHYVNHYGLAYKRVGVFFFLLIIFAILILTWLKINRNYTMKYWLNNAAAAALGVVAVSAIFDWSSVIVKYNLKNYKKSFVHLEYLITMPDRTLPHLIQYRKMFEDIKLEQNRLGYNYSDTVNGAYVDDLLEERIIEFKETHNKKKWQEFSYADEKAYRSLYR